MSVPASPLRERFERLKYEGEVARRAEAKVSIQPGEESENLAIGKFSKLTLNGKDHEGARCKTSLVRLPSMDQLGVANMRAVSMDGNVTVAQLNFLKRLFHKTQEASKAANLGKDQHEGLDRENFVHIFSQAFDTVVEEVERMFDKLDANADGTVTCDEFLGYMVDKNTRMHKTEEAFCLVPVQRSSSVILEHGNIDKIISIPIKKCIAAMAGGTLVLIWVLENLELVHSITTPACPFSGDTPLTDPDFMNYEATTDAELSGTTEKAQATSRVVDIVYWDDDVSGNRYLVVLTNNSMFRPFLTMYDCQRGFKELSCIPLSSSRDPTCLTILTDPNAADQFLVGHTDGSCAAYEAPREENAKGRGRKNSSPPCKLLDVYPLHSDYSPTNLKDKKAGDLITRLEVLPVLGRTKLVSTGLDGVLSVANIEMMKQPMQKRTPRQGLNSFSFSARSSFFATAGIDRTVRLWNADSCSVLENLLGHKAAVIEVIINDDLRHIMSASADHTVKVWDIRTLKCLQTFSTAAEGGHVGLRQEMTALHYDPQSRLAISAGAGVMSTWAVETTAGSVVSKQEGADESASPISACVMRTLYCATFQQLVVVHTNGVVIVYDLTTELPAIRFNVGHTAPVTAACLDGRERRLITGSHSGTLFVHNFNNAQLLHKFAPRAAEISELVPLPKISSSSSYSIVASCWDKKVCLWPDKDQTQAGVDVMELSAHKTDVMCVVQYQQCLATGSADGMLMIWYSRSVDFNFARIPKYKFKVPGEPLSKGRPSVVKLLYLPLQQQLLVCIQDGWMHIYSALGQGLQGECIAKAGEGIAAASLSPNAKQVVTGDYKGLVRVWDLSGSGTHTSMTEAASWRDGANAASITSVTYCNLDGETYFYCSDVAGRAAALRADGTFSHFLGQRPAPVEPVSENGFTATIEIETQELALDS
jgi:WD40 repeat protein